MTPQGMLGERGILKAKGRAQVSAFSHLFVFFFCVGEVDTGIVLQAL